MEQKDYANESVYQSNYRLDTNDSLTGRSSTKLLFPDRVRSILPQTVSLRLMRRMYLWSALSLGLVVRPARTESVMNPPRKKGSFFEKLRTSCPGQPSSLPLWSSVNASAFMVSSRSSKTTFNGLGVFQGNREHSAAGKASPHRFQTSFHCSVTSLHSCE